MRGRKPTPTALKLLAGNPGHRPIDAAHEPSPVVGLGEPPAHLHGDPEAMRYWMSQGAELVKIKTLTEADGAHFANLCLLYSRGIWLTHRINEMRKKKTFTDKAENKLMTLESQRIKTASAFQKIATEFGMGAASRTRIKVPDNQLDLPFGQTESSFDKTMRLAGAR